MVLGEIGLPVFGLISDSLWSRKAITSFVVTHAASSCFRKATNRFMVEE